MSTFAMRRTGYRAPIAAGAAIMGVGVLVLAVHPVGGITPFVWLAMFTILIGMGRGINNPASRFVGLQLAPKSISPLAALRTMSMQLGTLVVVTADIAN